MRLFNHRDNNGSNITEPNALNQTGWGAYTWTTTGSSASITVTFPQAFTNPPIVTAVFGGDQASGTVAYGSGGASVNGTVFVRASGITSTGCTITFWGWGSAGSANWTSGNIVYIQWIAIGT
jgi:hypothetical protein